MFLRVITGDETWCFQYNSKQKRQSMQWKTQNSHRPEKTRMSRWQVKTMLVCFFVSAQINKLCFHGAIPENKLSNHVSKFYFIFIQSSTCFGRHTAHYQEHKTALAASGFTYVEGCWACSCWTLSEYAHTLPESVQQLHVQQPSTYVKPQTASAVLDS